MIDSKTYLTFLFFVFPDLVEKPMKQDSGLLGPRLIAANWVNRNLFIAQLKL